MSVRTDLAAALAAGLPTTTGPTGYRVIGYQRAPDRVDQRTVMVWQDTITPHGIGSDLLIVSLTVWVLTPRLDPETADDDLDAALLDVLAVLHPLDAFTWGPAERGVFAETAHGYKLTVTAATQVTPDPTGETP